MLDTVHGNDHTYQWCERCPQPHRAGTAQQLALAPALSASVTSTVSALKARRFDLSPATVS
ncbi:hypothetical protein LPU83_1255 [Rhizobium favelukesii]|uniref:Uncharacterized protein n=1 Tax=Rhizobium favelukesii TaxID=348824 RepID=W6R7Q4_9HYPH|nr:hypothetical protein LPU83_1255 [Rhizobium favelukesii]